MHRSVAPFTGAWIEIGRRSGMDAGRASLPSRERGLKCNHRGARGHPGRVAPFTGAWIEIMATRPPGRAMPVAPFTGAWIEITVKDGKDARVYRRSLHGSVD